MKFFYSTLTQKSSCSMREYNTFYAWSAFVPKYQKDFFQKNIRFFLFLALGLELEILLGFFLRKVQKFFQREQRFKSNQVSFQSMRNFQGIIFIVKIQETFSGKSFSFWSWSWKVRQAAAYSTASLSIIIKKSLCEKVQVSLSKLHQN